MRALLFTFSVLLFCNHCGFSQYRLKGFLGVEGGESFNYILEFSDSSGHIKGYSYTYRTEKKEVKARVEGFLDKESRTLSFKEKELIYNHGFESYATICLIQAVLKFVKEDNNTVFKGAITTNDITNVSCSGGTILINDETVVQAIFESKNTQPEEKAPANPGRSFVKSIKYTYDTATRRATPVSVRDSSIEITEGKSTTISWDSDTIVLYVWDGGKIDGDIVSIFLNNKKILDSYTLTKDKKKVLIPLTSQGITFTILAENEGNELPNTANIQIVDNDKQHNILTYNAAGKTAKIQIVKK